MADFSIAPISDLDLQTSERSNIEPTNALPVPTQPLPGYAITTPTTSVDAKEWEEIFAAAFDKTVTLGDTAAINKLLDEGVMHPQLDSLPMLDGSVQAAALGKLASMKHKKAWVPQRQKLAVYRARSEITAALRSGWLVSVAGTGAGCGRTTQLPQIVMETEMFKNKRVVVVEQSATMAIATAKRLRDETGESAAYIAHAVPLDLAASSSTTVVVTTPDVLIRSLLCNDRLRGTSCVIVDDAHEFTTKNILLLALLKDAVMTANGKLRLVLSSGSPAIEQTLSTYFKALNTPDHPNGHVVVSPSTTEEVPSTAVMFLEQAGQWFRAPSLRPDVDSLTEDKAHIDTLNLLGTLNRADFSAHSTGFKTHWAPFIAGLVRQYCQVSSDVQDGQANNAAKTSLVLLPTLAHSRVIKNELQAQGVTETVSVRLIDDSLSKSIDHALQMVEHAFPKEEPKMRRVLLISGSDLCNGALTIPGVDFVLDSGRELHQAYDFALQCDRLDMDWCSLSALRARRNTITATASTEASMIIHLVPKQLTQATLTSTESHPIFRASGAELLSFVSIVRMHLGTAGKLSHKSAKAIASKLWNGPADVLLNSDRLLRVCSHADERLTSLGHVQDEAALQPLGIIATLMNLPVPVARLLTFAACLDVLPEALTIASMWLVGSLYASYCAEDEHADEGQIHGGREYFADGGSDIKAHANMANLLSRTTSDSDIEEAGFSKVACDAFFAVRRQLAHLVSTKLSWIEKEKVEDTALVGALDAATNPINKNGISPLLDACITGALYPNISATWSATHNNQEQIVLARQHDNSQQDMEGSFVSTALQHAVIPHFSNVSQENRFTDTPSLYLSAVRCLPGSSRAAGERTHEGQTITVLNEAAADVQATVVFCGSGEKDPVKKRTRCRGWMAPMTNAWRETNAARNLPPVSAIEPRPIETRRYYTDTPAKCKLYVDRIVGYAVQENTANILLKLRNNLRTKIERLLSRERGDLRGIASGAFSFLANRSSEASGFLRKRRQDTYSSGSGTSAGLQAPYHFTYDLGHPTASSSSITENAAGQKGQSSSTTFTGTMPPPSMQELIRKVAETVGETGSREKENELLRVSAGSSQFDFLKPTHAYHQYYTHVLKQVAPQLSWLGDDLPELEEFLKGIESELRLELGLDTGAQDQQQQQMPEQQQYAAATAAADSFEAQGSSIALPSAVPLINPSLQVPANVEGEVPQSLDNLITSDNVGGFGAQKTQKQHGDDEVIPSIINPNAQPQAAAIEVPSKPPLRIDPSMVPPLPPGVDCTGLVEFSEECYQNLEGNEADVTGGDMPYDEWLKDNKPTFQLGAPTGGDAPADPFATEPTAEDNTDMALLQSMVFGGAHTAATGEPAMSLNPLAQPPPPVVFGPQDPEPHPAVIVYPLPKLGVRKELNLPLIMAKALGETMDVKVGPTYIVGDRARIEVPNARVEQRALHLKRFVCLGETLFIGANTIFDNVKRATVSQYKRDLVAKKKFRDDEEAPYYRGRGRGGFEGGRGRGRGRGRGGYDEGFNQQQELGLLQPPAAPVGEVQQQPFSSAPVLEAAPPVTDAPPPVVQEFGGFPGRKEKPSGGLLDDASSVSDSSLWSNDS